ncbi:MAG: alkaline phosphatase [Coriobacteriia bacterium]
MDRASRSWLRPALYLAAVLVALAIVQWGAAGERAEDTQPAPEPSVATSTPSTETAEIRADTAPKAKNVILFIGDGMGFAQVAASGLYENGKAGTLPFESFPVTLAMSTYPAGGGYDPDEVWSDPETVKSGATDSAAAATAMSTGVKTVNGAIGVDPEGRALGNLMEASEQLGKATGLVTSVPFSHATPAAFAAHHPDRHDYEEIAGQMLLESALDVIMGAGNPDFDDDAEPAGILRGYEYVGGRDLWEQLARGEAGGDADGDGEPDPWTLLQDASEFDSLAEGPAPSRVLGVAKVSDTLQEERDGGGDMPFDAPFNEGVPTLAQMTRAALNILDDDPDGFILVVEGGAIDWACHDHDLARMLEEMRDFTAAVDAASTWTEAESGWSETLVIVTADHETGFLTGPEYEPDDTAREWLEPAGRGRGQLPRVEWHTAGHTNQLVPLFAKGAGADTFELAADQYDPVRGPYLDNTELAEGIWRLLR